MRITIEETRATIGLSQSDMAVCMGMTQPMVARIETGKRKETHGHQALLMAIKSLFNNDILEQFLEERKRYIIAHAF